MDDKQNFSALLAKVILPKVEVIAALTSAVGFFLYYLNQPGAQQLLMIGLSTLAGVFFLTANTFPPALEKTSPAKNRKSFADLLLTILWKVIHIAMSVSTIGLLFFLLLLKGFEQMMAIGTTAIIISLLFVGFFILQNNEHLPAFRASIVKGLLLAFICISIMYTLWPLRTS